MKYNFVKSSFNMADIKSIYIYIQNIERKRSYGKENISFLFFKGGLLCTHGISKKLAYQQNLLALELRLRNLCIFYSKPASILTSFDERNLFMVTSYRKSKVFLKWFIKESLRDLNQSTTHDDVD